MSYLDSLTPEQQIQLFSPLAEFQELETLHLINNCFNTVELREECLKIDEQAIPWTFVPPSLKKCGKEPITVEDSQSAIIDFYLNRAGTIVKVLIVQFPILVQYCQNFTVTEKLIILEANFKYFNFVKSRVGAIFAVSVRMPIDEAFFEIPQKVPVSNQTSESYIKADGIKELSSGSRARQGICGVRDVVKHIPCCSASSVKFWLQFVVLDEYYPEIAAAEIWCIYGKITEDLILNATCRDLTLIDTPDPIKYMRIMFNKWKYGPCEKHATMAIQCPEHRADRYFERITKCPVAKTPRNCISGEDLKGDIRIRLSWKKTVIIHKETMKSWYNDNDSILIMRVEDSWCGAQRLCRLGFALMMIAGIIGFLVYWKEIDFSSFEARTF
uniref:Uncharacterized protein n=1 Tax=Caenorhabditis japonica TaxID=281687 RepID=A0A8R1HN84_CAEJA